MNFDTDKFIQQLRQVRHFKNLPDVDLKAIIQAGQVLRYAANTVIFDEGAPCSGMFVLLGGKVHLCKAGPKGRKVILAEINPVIMFNEVAVIDGGSNPVCAMAVDDCLTWHIGYERFQVLLQRYPQLGIGLLKVLARRNRILLAQQENLTFKTSVARLARLLLELSQQGSQAINRRQHSNLEFSARTATVPEVISRSLKGFKQAGFIIYDRQSIRVTRPAELAALAELTPDDVVIARQL